MSDTTTSDGPTITFGPSAAETVLEELGFGVADGGVIIDEAGEPVEPAFGEAPITVRELGGFIEDDAGEIQTVADDFSSLVEYVKQYQYEDSEPNSAEANA